MSVTQKRVAVAPSYISNIDAIGSVSGDTTSFHFQFDNADINIDSVSDIPVTSMTIEGTTYNITWTVTAWHIIDAGVAQIRYVDKAVSQNFSFNKPWLALYIPVWSTGCTLSFYDIECCPTVLQVSGNQYIDGIDPITAKASALQTGTDGTLTFKWQLGNRSYTSDVISVSAQQQTYTIPYAWVDQIPSGNQGTLTVTCQVKYGTQVYRTLTNYFTVYVPDNITPAITSVTLSDVINSPVPVSWGSTFVQHKSGLRISAITCAPSDGASLTYITMTVGEQTTGRQVYDASNLPQIDVVTQSGSLTVTIVLEDSRGRQGSRQATLNYLPYSSPQLKELSSTRCDSNGNVDNDGTYFLSSSRVLFSSCNGLNAITLNVQYKRTDVSSYGNAQQIYSNVTSTPCVRDAVIGGGLIDPEFSYDVRYTLTDAFSTIIFVDYVSTAVYLMHFLHGGRGVAFGQKATVQDCLDCAFDAHFRQQSVFDDEVTFTYTDDNSQVQTITMTEILRLLGVISAT